MDILSHGGTTRVSADTEAGADTAMQIHALLLKTPNLQGGKQLLHRTIDGCQEILKIQGYPVITLMA